MRTKNDQLNLSSSDVSSSITSDAIWLGHIVNMSVQVVLTGSPNATLRLEASNDEGATENNLANATITNWTEIPTTSQTVNAAGSVLINLQDVGYRWFRLVWTGGGTGTISARYNLKGI